jgi:hypothetical protein
MVPVAVDAGLLCALAKVARKRIEQAVTNRIFIEFQVNR